ncbi:MAG: PEP-CTERM sorting domain-containing protein [Candidatus Aminicenantales bacterium]
MKRAKIVVLSVILLFFVLSTVASAAGMWPGWWKSKTDQHSGTTGTAGGTGSSAVSVPEPAIIALLGAGLVSLGLYAKRKRGKKQ